MDKYSATEYKRDGWMDGWMEKAMMRKERRKVSGVVAESKSQSS
jgi:hypothetical protein